MALRGQYEHSLDSKDRLTVPARFRAALADGVVLSAGLDPCVEVYPTSEYARFQRPGHRVTGDRSGQDRQHRDGVDIVHAIIDEHSRLAYAEIHDDQQAATVVDFLERALAFYAEHGIAPQRLMTDG